MLHQLNGSCLHSGKASSCCVQGGQRERSRQLPATRPLMPVGFSITAWHEGPGAHIHDGEIEGATAPGTHFPSALGSSPVGGPAAGLICGASIVIQQSGGGFGGPPQQSTVLQAVVADGICRMKCRPFLDPTACLWASAVPALAPVRDVAKSHQL